jgi:hypothetical protein
MGAEHERPLGDRLLQFFGHLEDLQATQASFFTGQDGFAGALDGDGIEALTDGTVAEHRGVLGSRAELQRQALVEQAGKAVLDDRAVDALGGEHEADVRRPDPAEQLRH